MSYVPHDSESQGIELVDNDRTVRQRALHSHVNFKPTTVIDHIKTKVQGKRSTHSNSKDASIVANNNNSNINSNINNNHNNNNNNTKYTSQEYIKSATKQALPMPLTQSNSTLPKLSDRNSFASQDNTFTDRTPSISAQPETLVNGSQNIDKDENSTRTVDWRIDTMDSDVETNHTFQIRDDDFNLIFNDLPSNEQLIIAYPCAWRKDIFMHGKMFLSVNYVCFYACFLKWSESLCIAYKDIISITREKSAKVVPNAIKLRTKNQEHFVASYIPRERIFIAIFRLWQNALLEQQLNYEQLRDVVYSGQMNNEESSDESDASIEQENNNRYIVNDFVHSQSLSQMHSNPSVKSALVSMTANDEFSSSLPSPKPIIYAQTCPCETHLSKTFADRIFLCDIDALFELVFGDNSFTHAYHDSQKLLDYAIGEWLVNRETGKRQRQVTYRAITQSILGTNTLFCTEKQTIEFEMSHSVYVVRTNVYNEGMKYTDAFFVATQFCLFQSDAEHCALRITAQIKYVKNVNAIARAFIEKNANGSIESGVHNLIQRLEIRQERLNNRDSNRKRVSTSKQTTPETKNEVKSPIEKKERVSFSSSIPPNDRVTMNEHALSTRFILNVTVFLGVFLILLHIYLCNKLHAIDQALFAPDVTCLNQCKAGLLFYFAYYLPNAFSLIFNSCLKTTLTMVRRKLKLSTFRWFYNTIAFILGIVPESSPIRRLSTKRYNRRIYITRRNKHTKAPTRRKCLQIDSNQSTSAKTNDICRISELTTIFNNNSNNRNLEDVICDNRNVNRSTEDHQKYILCIRVENKNEAESIQNLLIKHAKPFKDSRIINLQELTQSPTAGINVTHEDASTMTYTDHMCHQLAACASFMSQTENVRRLKALQYIRLFIEMCKEDFFNYLINEEHLCQQKTSTIYRIIKEFLTAIYQSEYEQTRKNTANRLE
ncbi:unnamed protein product [Rotaria magnacalcarata]|uniref:VASt domain-containing protein n=1 Tax=Rotaria magnacalcarata TaxID=392030 RepID=A0A819EXQ0_9BILA|nr:unnamed protein product [Rotaria magnacalcarata]